MDVAEITKQLLELNLKSDDIADEGLRNNFALLLQIIEELYRENEKLKNENIILKKHLKDEDVIVQEVYYSKSKKETYIANLPDGIKGEYGPGIKSLVPIMKYVCNMSELKIRYWQG